MRLAGCLKLFLPRRFNVETLDKLGSQFVMQQMLYTGVPVHLCQCYPFHGAPDITINDFPIVLCSDSEVVGEEVESESEPDSINEMAQQAPGLGEYPPKLGELIATMHTALVKEILNVFVRKKKQEEVKVVSRGLLLHKATGGVMVEMSVELMKNRPGELKIRVDDSACATLTPSALCRHLQRLLMCGNIHQ